MKLKRADTLTKGDVILMPFNRTAVLIKEPIVGKQYVTIRTAYGVRRLSVLDDVTVEADDEA